MLTIGLTGGICSGKSTAAQFFAELGIPVIDADKIARSLVQDDARVQEQIISHFGKDICNAQGQIDRQQLRQIIFSQAQQRAWLEDLLHPLIRQQIKAAIAQARSSYVVVVIPLLVETQKEDYIDRILVVDVPESVQLSRLTKRDNLDKAGAQAMLQAQTTRAARLAQADDIIENTENYQILKNKVQQLHANYVKLAQIIK